DEGSVTRALQWILPSYRRILSAKLVMFGGMLNACEALGGFMLPTYTGSDRNRRRFEEFMRTHMQQWSVMLSMPSGGVDDLVEVLWKRYRNAIAHGFQVENGGIEYLPNGVRYSVATGWTRICPRQFLADYEAGFNTLIKDCRQNAGSLASFQARFQDVYPS